MEGEMEGLVVEKNMQEKLRDLVRYGDELRKLEQQLGRFNLFAVLGTTHQELKHSNILAWLFNPAEGHGLGDAMLRAWLMAVYEFIDGETDKDAEQLKIDPVDVDTTTFRSVQVYREWNRVDLLIKIDTVEQGEWIVAVENKIESKQGQSQLKRYGEKIDR